MLASSREPGQQRKRRLASDCKKPKQQTSRLMAIPCATHLPSNFRPDLFHPVLFSSPSCAKPSPERHSQISTRKAPKGRIYLGIRRVLCFAVASLEYVRGVQLVSNGSVASLGIKAKSLLLTLWLLGGRCRYSADCKALRHQHSQMQL